MKYVKVKREDFSSMPAVARTIGMPYETFWRKVREGYFLSPKRQCGNRFYYNEEDVNHIKRQAALLNGG